MSNERIDLKYLLEEDSLLQDLNWSIARFEQVEKLVKEMTAELKRCYERIDYLESVAEEYRQERPEEYCANCYAYLSEYDGDGVKECLCSDCEASE